MNEPKTTRQCDQCGKDYEAATVRSRFCSGACRAKHSRAAHGAIVDNRQAAMLRTVATRSSQLHRAVCPICGDTFIYSDNGRRPIYCGAACRKRAFNAAHNEPIEENAADEHEATVERVNNSADVLAELFVGSMTMQQIRFAAKKVAEERRSDYGEGKPRNPNIRSIPSHAA